MFKKLAYFAGCLLLLSLLLLFCFTLGLWQNWSTPAILLFWLLMLLLAALLWACIYALTRVIKGKQGRRWLEKYRLSRRHYVLLSHWKHGASIIKRVRRQQAQLPWYLLVGPRCGKSALLASAELPRFDSRSDDIIAGPTRTLRWWFFRQLCVLDLSSNFLNGTTRFRQSWGKVAQWCSRMPAPAGIIVTLPAGALMSDDLSTLHTLARQQRGLIDPLVHRFGECLPLYVMVTQCDQFPGFSLWSRQLSVAQRQQPLGYTWQTPPSVDGQDELMLQALFSALKQGMSQIRMSMGCPVTLNARERTLLLDFPESFASLEPKLRYFLASLCEPNAYFSHTSLRSVWFSATEPQAENRSRRTGVFIHNLLAGHLRNLSLLRRNLRWYQRTRGKIAGITVLTVGALWIVISAFFSFNRLQPEVTQLSSDALAAFLEQDEHVSSSAPNYIPFTPLIEKQYQRAESQLANILSTPRPIQTTLMAFQQQAFAAEPDHYRELILQLSHAILIWKQMRDGVTLEVLNQQPSVLTTLLQRNYPDPLSPLAVLALERHYIQQPDGEYRLQAARELLTTLVNHDPELTWLTAPLSTLPALQARLFWPSLPDTVALPGIRTKTGEHMLNDWMVQIERATGHPQPIFRAVREHSATQRQDAWKQYLIDIASRLTSIPPATLPDRQLIAISQNQSQSMQFASRVLTELEDIPQEQAQPWLFTLRRLQKLVEDEHSSALLSHIKQADNRLRTSFISWIQGGRTEQRNSSLPPLSQTWRKWLVIRNGAVKEAVAQDKPNVQLTRELFAPEQGAGGHNPLTEVLPVLTTLQEQLSPQNNDASVAAIWSLYQDDARRLLGNAIARSACWMNNQWKSMVIWPLNKNSDQRTYEEQQKQSQQSVSAFLHSPAKTLLFPDSNGLAAADYAGIKVPLTDDFINFTHHAFLPEMAQDMPLRSSTRDNDRHAALQEQLATLTRKRNELEKKNWKISVTSLPVTVPGGAKVFPTGTQLTLNCLKGDQQLNSMNFAEKQDFQWQPGQCPGVTLNVIFPDFTATYQLHGDDAWPYFVNLFTDNEALIDNRDFGDSAGLLQQLEIKQILVRFTVSAQQEMEEAWQEWNDINNSINDLDAQISSLDERTQSVTLNPISALPDDIAQCQ